MTEPKHVWLVFRENWSSSSAWTGVHGLIDVRLQDDIDLNKYLFNPVGPKVTAIKLDVKDVKVAGGDSGV